MNRATAHTSLVVALATLGSCATEPPVPSAGAYSSSWKRVCYRSFAEDVDHLAGPTALDCGMAGLDANRRTRDRVATCAKRAASTDQPFKFGYVGAGDDSLFCDVAVRTPEGQLWSFYMDYDVTGQMGTDGRNSAVWVSRCDKLEFKPGTMFWGSFFNLSECKEAPDITARLVSERTSK